MITIVQVETETQIRHAQALFEEYFDFLRTDVDNTVDDLNDVPPLAGYRDEIAMLPGKYAPPEGRLLLAYDKATPLVVWRSTSSVRAFAKSSACGRARRSGVVGSAGCWLNR